MNPYTLMAGAVALLGAVSLSFAAGWHINDNRRDSQLLAIERAAAAASEAATTAAVEAIKQIRITRTTIRQELEREIHHAPAVGAECTVTDGVLDAINRALAPPAADRAGVSGPDTAG